MEIKFDFNLVELEEMIRTISREELVRANDLLYARLIGHINQNKELLTVFELCKELRISRTTANKLIRNREIESVKNGGKRFIERNAIDNYRNNSKNSKS